MIDGSEVPIRVTSDHRLAEEWELALLAQGFSPGVSHTPEGFLLSVPEHEAESAREALSAYERENPREPPARAEPAEPPDLLTGAWVAALFLLFFVVTEVVHPAAPWLERGSADAERILRGEIWRAVTALTLHANLAHALSNGAGITLFLGALSSILGAGMASALFLLAGAAGNLINALVHESAHISIGASTSVFGAVGMLGSLGLARRGRRKAPRRRAWAPVAAALALLAMLGTGGERVDVLAHLFGFFFGAVFGALAPVVAPLRPGVFAQWIWGGAAVAALVCSWLAALN